MGVTAPVGDGALVDVWGQPHNGLRREGPSAITQPNPWPCTDKSPGSSLGGRGGHKLPPARRKHLVPSPQPLAVPSQPVTAAQIWLLLIQDIPPLLYPLNTITRTSPGGFWAHPKVLEGPFGGALTDTALPVQRGLEARVAGALVGADDVDAAPVATEVVTEGALVDV